MSLGMYILYFTAFLMGFSAGNEGQNWWIVFAYLMLFIGFDLIFLKVLPELWLKVRPKKKS